MAEFIVQFQDVELTVKLLLQFFMAMLFGGAIGLERGLRQQAAGLRTHMMVCIGATAAMMVGEYVYMTLGYGDPMRLGAQVVSGIGFLGAGTIIVTKQSRVRGLTTAASLWAAACMGLAIGAEFYLCATVMMIVILFILYFVSRIDAKYVKTMFHVSLFMELEPDCRFGKILKSIKAQGWVVQDISELSFLDDEDSVHIRVDLLCDDHKKKTNILLDEIRVYDKIRYVDTM